jgi:hypothetical protein
MKTIIALTLIAFAFTTYGQKKEYLFIRVLPDNLTYSTVDPLSLCSLPLTKDQIKSINCFRFQIDTISEKMMKEVKKMYKYGTNKNNFNYSGILLEKPDYNILEFLTIESISIGYKDRSTVKIKSEECLSPLENYFASQNNCLTDEMKKELNKDFSAYKRTIWFGGIIVLNKKDNSETILSFGFSEVE